MRKISVLLVLVFFASSFAFSQNAYVDKINKYCTDLNDKLSAEGEYRNYVMIHTVNFESNVRAIGKQNTTISFYYTQPGDSVKEENGISEFIDIYKPPLKITIEYNIAASQKVSIEYYPDEKGKLVYFHYNTKGEYTNGEEFFYFKDGKPVKIKYIATDEGKEVLEKYKTLDKESGFAKEELKKCDSILKKFGEYIKFFDSMIKIEKTDK